MRFVLIKFIIFFGFLNASGVLFSSVPMPSVEVVDINIDKCDKNCLEEHIENGKPFSYAAKSSDNKTDGSSKNFTNYDNNKKDIKVAILLPSKVIGSYSTYVTNTVLAYFLSTDSYFEVKTFDSTDESIDNLDAAIKEIVKEGFSYCIAPVTKEGANNLAAINSSLNIFVPTVNQKNVENKNYLMVYGGIDYDAQVKKLEKMFKKQLFIFEEAGAISKRISDLAAHNSDLPVTRLMVKSNSEDYSNIFESVNIGVESTVLLNTQPIKSSLLLSQFTYRDFNLSAIFSTQINYSPVLLGLTQPMDLKKLYVANSISTKNSKIEEYNNLLHNDIVYNWINYSTSILCDFIFQSINRNYDPKSKSFGLTLIDKQINYDVQIYKVGYRSFFKPEM